MKRELLILELRLAYETEKRLLEKKHGSISAAEKKK